MRVSVITPWLDHPELIPGYAEVVDGADEVIIVCNRGDHRLFSERGWQTIEPLAPLGFAESNNRGAAVATGDVVLYLNNDVVGSSGLIEAVRRDVRDGALYGPSIGRQLLDGVVVPYVEGWCVAATRDTWSVVGGWDAEAFPRPYWEDVDISFRALRRGIGMKRAPWPVGHLGGTTTRTTPGAWDGFLEQRAVIESRLREAMSEAATA